MDCEKEEKIIVGCSGGPDSMALASMLLDQGLKPILAHVNYHKRSTADRDERIVENFARKHGLVFEKTDALQEESGNFQARARDFRYRFFEQVAKKHGTSIIAVAHNEDDLIETWIMQKRRGIIPQTFGLAPVLKRNGYWLIRPLLNKTKRELEIYCLQNGISYGIDESNLEDHYLRNRIRHHLVQQLLPDERKRITTMITDLNRMMDYFRQSVPHLLQEDWLSLPYAWYILGELVWKMGKRRLSGKDLQEKAGHLKNGHPIEFPGFSIERSGKSILLIPYENNMDEHIFDSKEEFSSFSQGDLSVKKTGMKIENIGLHEEDFPVRIRFGKKDDLITMRFGKKRLSRFFIDRRIPHALRKRWPVIENRNGKVIFVAGLGSDKNHFDPDSELFLTFSLDSAQKIAERYDIINFDFNFGKED